MSNPAKAEGSLFERQVNAEVDIKRPRTGVGAYVVMPLLVDERLR